VLQRGTRLVGARGLLLRGVEFVLLVERRAQLGGGGGVGEEFLSLWA